jgi:REP element-mobilizing transposase RayT
MARKLRVQYPGAIYHVLNRGDRREPIFHDDKDRQRFLQTLGEACEKTGWHIHAWCLMPNHFHLVIETPKANLVAGMKWFLGAYTGRFNRRHKLFGHLFSGRYKALIVDGSGTGYLKTVCDYVHLNPARAKLLGLEAARLAAGGAAAGGAWGSVRQQGRAAGVWTADGTASPGGGRTRAIQAGPSGMVFGRQGISEGVTGADEGTNEGTSLWRGTCGNGTGRGRRNSAGGNEAAGVERGRPGSTA